MLNHLPNRRPTYRITRRMAAIHRAHRAAPYPACVICISQAATIR